MPRVHHDRLRGRFTERIVVGDGGMGSELIARLEPGAPLDLAPLEHPHEVLAIHLAYLRAGAEVIETASFAASRPRLARRHEADLVEAVNAVAVKLAREARDMAGVDCLVAGSIGPLAGVLDFDDPGERAAIMAAHAEQASILAGRGADLLILESFFRPDELEGAIAAVASVTAVPLVALLTFPAEALPAERKPQAAVVTRLLLDHDLLAAGVNCAPGPQGALEILEQIGEAQTPLAAMPNAGLLVRRDGRILLPPATPSYLATFATRAAQLGVGFVGGCCGTGPEHIHAMAAAVSGIRPAAGRRALVAVAAVTEDHPAVAGPPSPLAEKLAAGRFVRLVQLDPPKGTNAGRILEAARSIAAHPAVDALDINSNPLARLRMDSLWLGAELQRVTGAEVIPHVTPRDASLMGLQAQLLGAWQAGVRNLLAISGDPSQLGDYPGVHDVYHVDIFELVRAVARLGRGVDCAGNPIGEPPDFCVGVAVNPGADDLRHEAERLRRKVEAGARFAMSQIFFAWEPWLRLLDEFGGEPPVPAIVGVWPLPSLRLALRLHHEVPGISVPEELLARLDAAGSEAARVGYEVAETMLAEADRHAAGVYLIAPFRNPLDILRLLPRP